MPGIEMSQMFRWAQHPAVFTRRPRSDVGLGGKISRMAKNKTKKKCTGVAILENKCGEKRNKILREIVKFIEEPKPHPIGTPLKLHNQNCLPPRSGTQTIRKLKFWLLTIKILAMWLQTTMVIKRKL